MEGIGKQEMGEAIVSMREKDFLVHFAHFAHFSFDSSQWKIGRDRTSHGYSIHSLISYRHAHVKLASEVCHGYVNDVTH